MTWRQCLTSSATFAFFVSFFIIKMEKLTLISGALFLTADIFAIISLALPFWIVTDVGGNLAYRNMRHWSNNGIIMENLCFILGETSLGLMWTCTTLYNRPKVCYSPDLPPEWMLGNILLLNFILVVDPNFIFSWFSIIWPAFTKKKLLYAYLLDVFL